MAIKAVTNKKGVSQGLNLISFVTTAASGNHCDLPNLSPFNLVLYHNGINQLPIIGDIIYEDINGLSVFSSQGSHQFQNNLYFTTDINGIMINLASCI